MKHTHKCKRCDREWSCLREDCCVGPDGRSYTARCDDCWDLVDFLVGCVAVCCLGLWSGLMVWRITT